MQVMSLVEGGQRGSALASAIMEHAGSLVSLAGEVAHARGPHAIAWLGARARPLTEPLCAAACAAFAAASRHAGALYGEKRYADAADAYAKSLSIFEMVEDVSVCHAVLCCAVPGWWEARAKVACWDGQLGPGWVSPRLCGPRASPQCGVAPAPRFPARPQVDKQCKCLVNLANLYELQVRSEKQARGGRQAVHVRHRRTSRAGPSRHAMPAAAAAHAVTAAR
jgi:hypothetical protein